MAPKGVVCVRSKKARKRSKAPSSTDYVPVVPLRVQDDRDLPIQISRGRRAKSVKVSNNNLTVSSALGYRSVQSSRGAYVGTWYFEVCIDHLGATGHCRLGVGTNKQEAEAPCGYAEHSMAFRDVDGSKVHKGWREPYGKKYQQSDVIGVWLHLPEGGRRMEATPEVVRWKGHLFQTVVEEQEPPKKLAGSALGFAINGNWQGLAFEGFLEGTYYATASLFTKPGPAEPASVTFNFGPDFKYGPPLVTGFPAARPFSEVPPPPPPQAPNAQVPFPAVSAVGSASNELLTPGGDQAQPPCEQGQDAASVDNAL